jgi:hypothetical protein
MDQTDFPKMDKTVITVSSLFDESDDKAYWLSRTPQERLQYVEMLRRINYGDAALGRIQKILEVIERTQEEPYAGDMGNILE